MWEVRESSERGIPFPPFPPHVGKSLRDKGSKGKFKESNCSQLRQLFESEFKGWLVRENLDGRNGSRFERPTNLPK